jgi:hypothetical protein
LTIEDIAHNSRMALARQEMCTEHKEATVVALLVGDVISGLIGPIAAEIDKPPSVTTPKTRLTYE